MYEEIISGASKWEERKELIRLLQNVEEGLYYAVVVVELSRLARSGRYSQEIADTLAENNVLIVTPTQTYDLTDNNHRLLFDIQSAVNSNEYRVIRGRMRTGTIEKAKRGEYVAAKAPYGYEAYLKMIKDRVKIRTLRPNSNAETVKLCFDLAEKGYSMKAIVRELNLRGLKSSKGGKFSFKSVQNMLHNKQYTGTLLFALKDKKDAEVIEVPDAFPAIVTKVQFNKVQNAIKGRTSGDNEVRNRSRGDVRTILKDLVYCANCGAKIGFQPTHSFMVKKCRCGMRGVTESRLVEAFWKELISLEKYFRVQWEQALETPTDVRIGDLKRRMDDLQSNKTRLSNKLKNARSNLNEGLFTKEEFLSDKAEIDKEMAAVESSIRELASKIAAFDKDELSRKYEDRLHWISDIRRIAQNRSKSLVWRVEEDSLPVITADDMPEVNRLLKLVIEKVTYRRFTHEEVIGVDVEGEKEIEIQDVIEVEIIPR
jgi:DNA invertase Pin-like site-specific DNA recombinase